MNIEQIMEIIPHRYPMLLLDEVDELKTMEYAHGYKAISYNENYFQGHFPQKPVLPGVIIIEALCQLCNVMIVSEEKYKGKIAYYAKLAKSNFFGMVKPGSVLELYAKKKAENGNLVVCETKAMVNGEIMFAGEMTFMVED